MPAGPEKESPGPAQEDIDAVYLKLARYAETGQELERIIKALLKQEGFPDIPDSAFTEGFELIDNIPRDLSCEMDGVGSGGDIRFEISLRDRFHRPEGETLDFRKSYRLQASATAVGMHKEELKREEAERKAEALRQEELLKEAMKTFRPYAMAHLGEKLTEEDWAAHGLQKAMAWAKIPEGGSWTITEEEGARLRVTIKDVKGSVHDVLEFDA